VKSRRVMINSETSELLFENLRYPRGLSRGGGQGLPPSRRHEMPGARVRSPPIIVGNGRWFIDKATRQKERGVFRHRSEPGHPFPIEGVRAGERRPHALRAAGFSRRRLGPRRTWHSPREAGLGGGQRRVQNLRRLRLRRRVRRRAQVPRARLFQVAHLDEPHPLLRRRARPGVAEVLLQALAEGRALAGQEVASCPSASLRRKIVRDAR